jgi:hypothetical protein
MEATVQDDGSIRPITSDNPIKSDEIELTEADKERLEKFPPEERHAELQRMHMERLRVLEEMHHEPDPDHKVEEAYQLMKDALLGIDRAQMRKEAAAAKERARKKKQKRKDATKSRKRNR